MTIHTEDLTATKIVHLWEIEGRVMRDLRGAREIWAVSLADGTDHAVIVRPDTTFCRTCIDPVCPAVMRFMIHQARQRNGEHSTLTNDRQGEQEQ